MIKRNRDHPKRRNRRRSGRIQGSYDGKIGRAINPNMMVAYMNAAGASRIEITSPVYKAIEKIRLRIAQKLILHMEDWKGVKNVQTG